MTRRLLASYLGLAVLILLLLEIPLALLAKRYEMDLSSGQAAREAAGLASLIGEDIEHGQISDLATLVTTYQKSTGGEVTVVAPNGNVIASSSHDADNDATTDWPALVEAGLRGTATSKFANDEGEPWAVAVTPMTVNNQPGGAVLLALPARATMARIHDIWLALAALAAAVLALTAGIGIILARSLSMPLTRLTAAVATLGQGDLGARAADDQGPPQLRKLGREFNHMAARLAEVVSAQSRFVAEASHQLRSPLTALRLRLENLEAEADDHTSEEIAAAGRELQRLSRVVDGLLTLSRAGNEEVRREPVDVAAVIAERCEAWAALAGERDVELVTLVDPDTGDGRHRFAELVQGDLEQILDNLLANALDASPAGATITVRHEPTSTNRVAIHVVDEGPGMTEEERSRAFDRFWTGVPSTSTGHSGLGLAIVRQLAARNDLAVELRPAEPRGLDAVVSVPTAIPAVAKAPGHVDQMTRPKNR